MQRGAPPRHIASPPLQKGPPLAEGCMGGCQAGEKKPLRLEGNWSSLPSDVVTSAHSGLQWEPLPPATLGLALCIRTKSVLYAANTQPDPAGACEPVCPWGLASTQKGQTQG